jgi:uncharacterized protein (TIGR02118 family)
MTVVMSVLYPATPGGRFDMDDYLATHIPLVRARWGPVGLLAVRVLRGTGTPQGGPPPFIVAAHLTFASAEALRLALEAHSAEVFAHIPAYTDITPVMTVSAVVEEG